MLANELKSLMLNAKEHNMQENINYVKKILTKCAKRGQDFGDVFIGPYAVEYGFKYIPDTEEYINPIIQHFTQEGLEVVHTGRALRFIWK